MTNGPAGAAPVVAGPTPARRVRVVVADDDMLVCAGLALLLGQDPGLEVVGQTTDGMQAVERCRTLRPDVLVTDLRMPGLDGVELTRQVLAGHPELRVLLVTTFDTDPDVQAAVLAGAHGYLLKRAAPADLVRAVHHVAVGEVWLDPAVAGYVVTALRTTPRPTAARSGVLARLTEREREVLTLLAHGLSNEELAHRLFLGEGTVKTHVSRILHKTDCRDRAQAVALAYTSGLVAV